MSEKQYLTVYHVSEHSDLKPESNYPMFLSLTKRNANGFINNAREIYITKYLYEVEIYARIVSKNEAMRILTENDIDYLDYVADLACNPEPEEVNNFDGTIILNQQYDGMTFLDYDPWDSQKDVVALVLWNIDTIHKWKKIPYMKHLKTFEGVFNNN